MTITTPEASKKSITITRILRAARQNATHAMASAMMKGIIDRFLTGSAVTSPSPPDLRVLHPQLGRVWCQAPLDLSTRFGLGARARPMGPTSAALLN